MKQKLLVVMLIIFAGAIGYLTSQVSSLSQSGGGGSKVKSFSFVLENSAYKPDTARVKLGDTVVFNIDNRDNESHGLHLQQFGVAEAIPPLQKTSITFTATKVGTVATTCAQGHPEKINVVVET